MTTQPDHAPSIWRMHADVLEDARGQAFEYAGPDAPPSVAEAAWSARVQTAVDGMDVADPHGLDIWMNKHAAAAAPHEMEAELVASYESLVREQYGSTGDDWEYADADQFTDHDSDGR